MTHPLRQLRREMLTTAKARWNALLAHAVTHCSWCDAPHTAADLERNTCPACGKYLDPFGPAQEPDR